MTAVAKPPNFSQHNRPAWIVSRGHAGQKLNQIDSEKLNRMFMPRKSLQRSNSSSSVSSTSSKSSTSTVVPAKNQTTHQAKSNGAPMPAGGDLSSRSNAPAPNRAKRPQGKGYFGPKLQPEVQADSGRQAQRSHTMNGSNGEAPSPILHSQPQMVAQLQQGMPRPMTDSSAPMAQPVLHLNSTNGTFERKTITVPFPPDILRIGRQTNAKTVPTPLNGFFDSKVLSRQHAEVWADRQGKIWIRDVKSSNGTFVNGTRLSPENRESEPHELLTNDRLELGIDIVSEDGKTVVHRKVAASVEHAGFYHGSSSVCDLTFYDLDPANGSFVLPGGMNYRGRNNGQMFVMSNGRMVMQPSAVPYTRPTMFLPNASTEHIAKTLQAEMKAARLQFHDLTRTGQFVSALLSKDDIRNSDKPAMPEPPRPVNPQHMANGNGPVFRTDNRARFSDPPAPPPQQPLPEKPDVPSLRRGVTDRPRTNPNSNASVPLGRQDGNVSQIIQLTEALSVASKKIDDQTSRMKDLEDMLREERQARELAEDLAKRLEHAAAMKPNGSSVKPNVESTLEQAFAPPEFPEANTPTTVSGQEQISHVDNITSSATTLQTQLECMIVEMKDLKQQLDTWKRRAEKAESQRDTDRKTLAEMALQIRGDTAAREAAEAALRKLGCLSNSCIPPAANARPGRAGGMERRTSSGSRGGRSMPGDVDGPPTLSRANTITQSSEIWGQTTQGHVLQNTLPYASMVGVVLLGIGLMAYINGWQPPPSRIDR